MTRTGMTRIDKFATVTATLIAIGALSYLAVSLSADGEHEPLESIRAGLTFDEIVIADQAGDVKLVGDIDGDGLSDFVLAGGPDEPLSWWRWPDLQRTKIATARKEFSTDGELGDIDGDGDLDIVVPDGPDADNLLWFENPRPANDASVPEHWRRHEIGAIGNWGKDVELADFDGDGRLDVAARSREQLMIFFQDQRHEWQAVRLDGFDLGDEGMASGDIDGSGTADLLVRGAWLSNPGGLSARRPGGWTAHRIADFDPAFKAITADIDGDGRLDVVTSSSEHTGDVAWFSADGGPDKAWTRHVVQPGVPGAHTLQAADLDRDGDTDLLVGQMHTTRQREVAILFNLDGRGRHWARQVIGSGGVHNGVLADIGSDGDFDVYGANWKGNPPLRLWINRLDPPDTARPINRWTYHAITNAHVRSFGLGFGDVDGDGRTDIISGPFWYRQPAEGWDGDWRQFHLGDGIDAFAAHDVDGDRRADIIAQRGGGETVQIVSLTAAAQDGTAFTEHLIGEIPRASHTLGSQGHAVADIVPGATAEIVVSSGAGVFYFERAGTPEANAWRRVRISAAASDEGIAVADIDGDGRLDLVATTGDAKELAWWRNPGDGAADWQRMDVGKLPEFGYPDRVGAADLDGDGRTDIVVTEENGKPDGARALWWRQPSRSGDTWQRREVTSRGSLHSLSVADINADGHADLVIGEHRGALRLSIWNNLGGARLIEQQIDAGKESHLGARTIDLDGDGDLDIVSIAWDRAEIIHVWRNRASEAKAEAENLPQGR